MISREYFDYQILRLTDSFYDAYPNPPYTEILKKKQRSYTCLLLKIHLDYYICIPFRSNITHRYAYHFGKSVRSREHHSGLDYSKIVIVRKSEYLTSEELIIDHDEYVETIRNIDQIYRGATQFVQAYIDHITGVKLLLPGEFDRRYHYAPLKYFHKELGIDSGNNGGDSGENPDMRNMPDVPAENP